MVKDFFSCSDLLCSDSGVPLCPWLNCSVQDVPDENSAHLSKKVPKMGVECCLVNFLSKNSCLIVKWETRSNNN